MIHLVLWSFVIATVPIALGLAWRLIAAIGTLLRAGYADPFEDADRSGLVLPTKWDKPTMSLPMSGGVCRRC